MTGYKVNQNGHYNNYTVKGMPILTIINGKLVMSDNEVLPNPEGKK